MVKLEKKKMMDDLACQQDRRPSIDELKQRNIMPEPNLGSPSLAPLSSAGEESTSFGLDQQPGGRWASSRRRTSCPKACVSAGSLASSMVALEKKRTSIGLDRQLAQRPTLDELKEKTSCQRGAWPWRTRPVR